MEKNPWRWRHISSTPTTASILVMLIFYLPLSASYSLSSGVHMIESQQYSTGRKLLQTQQKCPVNFQSANYTILTSKCRGPYWPPAACCDAFLEFACPYADALNDAHNDCATTMFSYIDLYGKYPQGLFASECKGDKDGLPCPAAPPAHSADAHGIGCHYLLLTLKLSLTLLTISFQLLL